MKVLRYWQQIGFLRQLLHGAALISGALLPLGGAPDYTATWDLFFNGVLPAMVPILLILIGFDVMMCKVLADGTDEQESKRLRNILISHYWVSAPVFLVFLMFIAPSLIP
jgi:heme/copper-type cytochrome/quinol oxidase subunit 2